MTRFTYSDSSWPSGKTTLASVMQQKTLSMLPNHQLAEPPPAAMRMGNAPSLFTCEWPQAGLAAATTVQQAQLEPCKHTTLLNAASLPIAEL